MNGFLLWIPFLFIRFVLMSAVNKKALPRAAHFAPMRGKAKIAYFIYQLANAGMLLYPIFLTIELSWVGGACYLLGLLLCAVTVLNFSAPDSTGLNTNGLYRFSRNPMYVSYFVCFVGMALLMRSLILFGLVMIFQVSAHWIILAEEAWCLENFGGQYEQYMKTVRRYL